MITALLGLTLSAHLFTAQSAKSMFEQTLTATDAVPAKVVYVKWSVKDASEENGSVVGA